MVALPVMAICFGEYSSLQGHNSPLKRSQRRKCGGVSGHHLESAAYKDLNRSLPLGRLLCILAKYHIFNNVRIYRDRRVWVVQGFPNFTPDAPRPSITTHFLLRIGRGGPLRLRAIRVSGG